MSKITQVLTSRKVWAAVGAIALAIFMRWEGTYSSREMAEAIMWALGVYTAAQGLTDAGEGIGRKRGES